MLGLKTKFEIIAWGKFIESLIVYIRKMIRFKWKVCESLLIMW